MPVKNLTTRTVDSIKPPEGGQVDYWDETLSGFFLRVTKNRKSWGVMYRLNRRQRRYSFGTYPNLGVAEARENARDALYAASKGRDPAEEKRVAAAAETFGEMASEYIERHAKVKKRSWRKDELTIAREMLPRWKHTKANAVKRRDIIKMLDDIADRGSPIGANRALEIVRKIYNWGISRDIVEANPCHQIPKPSPERQRARVLNDAEIKKVWDAAVTDTPAQCGIFRLRLITLQRGHEICRLRKADRDGQWWNIPAEFTKNKRAHRVWLSRLALSIVEEAERVSSDSPWTFPSPRVNRQGEEIPITWTHKASDNIRTASGVDFQPHDLRRTASTKMTGDLEIDRSTVKKILNHVDPEVTGVYDRYSYDREKREAMDAWDAHLAAILAKKDRA
jgi:integrase